MKIKLTNLWSWKEQLGRIRGLYYIVFFNITAYTNKAYRVSVSATVLNFKIEFKFFDANDRHTIHK